MERQPPAPPRVAPGEEGLVFSWFQPKQGYRTATRVDQIPECCRRDVVVVDAKRSPEERQAERFVMTTDLSVPLDDGSFPVVVMSRYRFRDLDLSDLGPATKSDGVVVYSTTWCGFCTKLKRWLDARGTAYIAKDIEHDPAAAKEMAAKLSAAGMQVGGVPVTDVKGALFKGFNKAGIEAALKAAGL